MRKVSSRYTNAKYVLVLSIRGHLDEVKRLMKGDSDEDLLKEGHPAVVKRTSKMWHSSGANWPSQDPRRSCRVTLS